ALEPARRVAAVLRAGRAAATAAGADAETVLWALWQAGGLAERWREAALAPAPAPAPGPAAERAVPDPARADRDLDAVTALLDAAARFGRLFPGGDGARRFLHRQARAEVPEDTLADRAPDDAAVVLTTPQGAAGREWDVVVVAGVQEGVWPDLRLRGPVLGVQALVDVLAGRDPDGPGARRVVLEDELRLFHVAVSRAREELVVTAVRDGEEQPSSFVDLVAAVPGARSGDGDAPTAGARPVSLPALVARLRQVACAPAAAEDPRRRAAAAVRLAELAAAGVPGADPADWYGLQPVSDAGPVRAQGEVVVSPSEVETFERCGLRWFLESSGARPARPPGLSIGALVHRVAAQAPAAEAVELRRRLEELWPSLGLAPGWVSAAARERAGRMLDKLADYHRDALARGRRLLAVEAPFEVLVDGVRVRGRVDRLEADADGRPLVVDLKTGRTQPTRAEVQRHPQLGVYQLAVAAGAFGAAAEGGGALLVQLGGTQRAAPQQQQRPLAEDEDPRWAAQLLQRVAAGMAAGRFEAVVGPQCGTCPVLSSCPAHEAGRSVAAGGAR
ncbi:ATP-dependent helicase, partial [Kineococcus sp. T13]|uniref:PD-(D/E)XK nuclease family protein n=1 Tax=Kineococcus vitellinus TaxID=2696565 RepID=UPI001412E0FD